MRNPDIMMATLLAFDAVFPVDGRESLEHPALSPHTRRGIGDTQRGTLGTGLASASRAADAEVWVCSDCGGTGRRPRSVSGCDCVVHCWCEAGDL